MTKIKTKLSQWLLKIVGKLDYTAYIDNAKKLDLTIYDKQNVEKIHAQIEISDIQVNSLNHLGFDFNYHVVRLLSKGIADEILKYFGKSSVKRSYDALNESTIYSLDIFVCKPKKVH